MAEDANYLRCEHGWKRDAWPADRDRCPHCTGTGEAPNFAVYQYPPWHCTDCRWDSVLKQFVGLEGRNIVHAGEAPILASELVNATVTDVSTAPMHRFRLTAAKLNTTHRMPEHEREYGG